MSKFREYLEKQQELFGSNKKEMVKSDLEHNSKKRANYMKLLYKKMKETTNPQFKELIAKFGGKYSDSEIRKDRTNEGFEFPTFKYSYIHFDFKGNDIVFEKFPAYPINSNDFEKIFEFAVKNPKSKNSQQFETQKHEVDYLPLKYDNLDKIKFRNTSLNEVGSNLISATITAIYKSFQDIWRKSPSIKNDIDVPVIIKSKHANSYITSISKKDNKVFLKVDEEMGRSWKRSYLTVNDKFPWNLKTAYKKIGGNHNDIEDANIDLENGIIKITLKEDNNE